MIISLGVPNSCQILSRDVSVAHAHNYLLIDEVLGLSIYVGAGTAVKLMVLI